MALVVKDRVQETSTTTGTGTITLAGAVTGFQSFSVIGNTNTTYYAIVGGTEWEVGLGTYTSSGTTLSRDTVLESSNGGTKVNFSAGTKNVFVTYPAEKSLYLDANNTFSLSGTNGIANATWATAGRPSSPSAGQQGYNTSLATIEFYDGTAWQAVSTGTYIIQYLVVAGGGGTSGGASEPAGGGGAGGLLYGSTSVASASNYELVVGAGGTGVSGNIASSNGANSTGFGLTAIGGGRGGHGNAGAGQAGGSGGGGSGWNTGAAGAGTSGQGNAGGTGGNLGAGGSYASGGGGGRSAVGVAAASNKGGNGGAGYQWLNGSYYAGGGGGSVLFTGTTGSGGIGGGGNGSTSTLNASGTSGTANTGGGGGAANGSGTGGSGGSGVVIIRYAGSQRGTGGTVTSSGGYTYHTFTTSGTFTA
jgi:hypothetical protein